MLVEIPFKGSHHMYRSEYLEVGLEFLRLFFLAFKDGNMLPVISTEKRAVFILVALRYTKVFTGSFCLDFSLHSTRAAYVKVKDILGLTQSSAAGSTSGH